MILFLSLSMLKMPLQVRAETSIPKPAIPEFNVRLIDSSYDVPATSSTDPYTGQTVTHPAYHVESRTIQVSIRNQPFTPYEITENENSWTVHFLYNIRFKGHYAEEWTEMFLVSDGYPCQDYESNYTVFSYQGEYSATEGMEFNAGSITTSFPAGAQVDFQVEAMIGYVHREISIPVPGTGWVFTGETSGWSNTQTITIGESQTPNSSPANSPTPSSESLQTEITTIVGVVIALAAIGAGLGLLIYLIKRK
jgi:hypothetical protein